MPARGVVCSQNLQLCLWGWQWKWAWARPRWLRVLKSLRISSGGTVPPGRKAPFVTQFCLPVNKAILHLACIKRPLTSLSCPAVFVFLLAQVLLDLFLLLILYLAEKKEAAGRREGRVVRWMSSIAWGLLLLKKSHPCV